MAAKPKQMHQIRRILDFLVLNYSTRRIARLTGIARNTVSEYRHVIERCGISLGDLQSAQDDVLAAIVYYKAAEPQKDARWQDMESRMPEILIELRRPGVTRKLLWEEYRLCCAEGYGYTQFCDHIARHVSTSDAVMHFEHRPGEQMQVDFTGDKLHYVDPATGEVIECETLICSLRYSHYTYIEALPSQKQEYFIRGLSNALIFFGGVPQSIKTDNLKPAVVRANRYEPTFTEAMDFLGHYYNTTVLAARVRKPRDKPAVENAVVNSYRSIYAPLRNTIFTSLEELNHALHQALEKYNARPFQKRDHSRKIIFETEEKGTLKPLPTLPYELRHTTQSKVQKNYHVIVGEDRHQYSVPYTLIGQTLKIIYTTTCVEIYQDQKRVAIHKRNYRKHGYSTLTEHMPVHHAYMIKSRGWDAAYFLEQATLIGPCTREYINRILSSKSFPEQTYNSCLGLLRLARKYTPDRLEAACGRALTSSASNYGMISNILKNGLDQIREPAQSTIPFHDNIRGDQNYH